MVYVPVNIFFHSYQDVSCLPGLNQHVAEEKVSCLRTQRSTSCESRTRDYLIQTLIGLPYHWVTTLLDKIRINPSKHVKAGLYGPTSETPYTWRFTGGPIVARYYTLAGIKSLTLKHYVYSVSLKQSKHSVLVLLNSLWNFY